MKLPAPRYKDGKKVRGGTTLYTPDVIPVVRNAILTFGANIPEIAKLLGIERKTFYMWRRKHPELEAAILEALDAYNAGSVEDTLRRRAMGYYYTETIAELVQDADAKTGRGKYRVTKKYRKYMPPDVVALKFWLSCRRPERWREVRAIEVDPGPKADRLAERLHAALERIGRPLPERVKMLAERVDDVAEQVDDDACDEAVDGPEEAGGGRASAD